MKRCLPLAENLDRMNGLIKNERSSPDFFQAEMQFIIHRPFLCVRDHPDVQDLRRHSGTRLQRMRRSHDTPDGVPSRSTNSAVIRDNNGTGLAETIWA